VNPARTYVDEISARVGRPIGKADRLGEIPRLAVGEPVGRRDADEQRLVVGPHLADSRDDLQGEPDPPLEVAAVGVVTCVCHRREELVEQVAVGSMDFGDLEARTVGADGGLDKGLGDRRDILVTHPARRRR